MPWVRLDDGYALHNKVQAVSLRARWLHLVSILWCSRGRTDGRIPRASLAALAVEAGYEPRSLGRLIDELTTVRLGFATGLWERDGDDYVVHDYLEYNPSAEQVTKEREAAKLRMKARRSGQSDPRSPEQQNAFARTGGERSPDVRPSRVRAGAAAPSPTPSPLPTTGNPPLAASSTSNAPTREAAGKAGEAPPVFFIRADEIFRRHPAYVPTPDFYAAVEGFAALGAEDVLARVVRLQNWLDQHPSVRPTTSFVLKALERWSREAALQAPAPLTIPAAATNGHGLNGHVAGAAKDDPYDIYFAAAEAYQAAAGTDPHSEEAIDGPDEPAGISLNPRPWEAQP